MRVTGIHEEANPNRKTNGGQDVPGKAATLRHEVYEPEELDSGKCRYRVSI
jgi:hypothetical protein